MKRKLKKSASIVQKPSISRLFLRQEELKSLIHVPLLEYVSKIIRILFFFFSFCPYGTLLRIHNPRRKRTQIMCSSLSSPRMRRREICFLRPPHFRFCRGGQRRWIQCATKTAQLGGITTQSEIGRLLGEEWMPRSTKSFKSTSLFNCCFY